jgi:hypothetical protein
MVAQKTYSSLFAYLFTCLLVVFVASCGGGSGGQAGTETANPLAANYNELTAIPGPMVAVRVGGMASLDGSDSAVTSTKPLSYSWSFSYKPDGSTAVLQGATTATPSFIADVRGVYTVQLLVSADGETSPRAVAIVVATNETESLIGPFPGHQGMSSNCGGCHNGVNLVGNGDFIPPKAPDHLATSNMCQACHTPQGFAIIPFVDHQEIFGNCSECHNNVIAIGKSEFHQVTDAECNDCHNTTSFLELNPDGSFDHTNITRACSGCHNGTVSRGKPLSTLEGGTHPVTTSECGYCHTTVTFKGGYPDHTGPEVIGPGITCDSCHIPNGSGPGMGQSIGHPITNVDCATCHSVLSFKMFGGIFNHQVVDPTVQSCESCHNDSTSINAPAKSSAVPTHVDTSADCGSCHNTESFTPSFGFDHDGVVDNCQTCHGNNSPVPPQVTATGKPLAIPLIYAHMPTNPDNPGTASDQDCGDCHTPGTFSTGTYDHAGVTSGCNSCHNNVIGVGQLLNHIPTILDQDCADCHNTTDFADVTFDHSSTNTSNCLACHDGNISKGKSLGHVSTNLNCSTCHLVAGNNYTTFAGTFDHAPSVVNNNCASCHNTGIAKPKKVNHIPAQAECSQCHTDTTTGGFASASNFLGSVHPGLTSGCEGCHASKFITDNPNAVKSASHIPTAQDCDVCHSNNSPFNPATNFTHAGITSNCESCHNGSVNNVAAGALGKAQATDHPATTADCGSCHAIGNNFTDGTFDHTGIVSNCSSCHGDSPTNTPVGPKKNPGHVLTSQDCSVCHVPGTFKNAVFDHAGIVNNCASCHDGVTATGKDAKVSPAHIVTNEDCSVCHNPTAFAAAKFDHTGVVNKGINCATCHDGATARGKTPPPDHVPTTQDCSVCHQTTGFIPGTFDHTGIVNNCRSCHDGKFAIGKTDTHVQTNQDCSVCHFTKLPLSFTGAIFDHTGIVDNCVSCHDGGTAIGMDAKTSPAHLATSLDCHNCHTTATFKGGTWVHDASTANNCKSCHNPTDGVATYYNSTTHLNTNEQCDVCHTTKGWAPSSFKHSSGSNYPGNHKKDPGCTGCHKGSIGAGINSGNYPSQLVYAPYCAGCHAKKFRSVDKHNGGKNGTIEQNKDCSGGGSGCHKVTSSGF